MLTSAGAGRASVTQPPTPRAEILIPPVVLPLKQMPSSGLASDLQIVQSWPLPAVVAYETGRRVGGRVHDANGGTLGFHAAVERLVVIAVIQRYQSRAIAANQIEEEFV